MKTKLYPYQRATKAERRIGRLWWCVHHGVMLEPLTEPPEVRAEYIRAEKPVHEIETRLRAMRPVRGRLPAPVARADAARVKVDAAWVRALVDHRPAIEALFARECADVAWGKDGLVFPAKETT